MEEVQRWWEVPAIAHFCSVFRAAFNLVYFDVEELEAAILNMQDPEMSISLEQLITRLLQGCYDDGEVTDDNWEEKLRELFEEFCDDDDVNPIIECAFCNFPPRTKVEILFKMCQIRLDISATEDIIKDMPAEIMQAKCIGQDEKKFSYWYFNDERLYKESPIKIAGKTGKINAPEKGKVKERPPLKSARSQKAQRSKETDKLNDSWSIVCYNVSDWEKLIKIFSKSRSKFEKEMAKEMKTKYLDKIADIINEKEKLLRKRLLEMAPKRTSSRISKVQAQRRIEEQRIAEAEDKRRREQEIELARKEELKKIEKKDSRRKRAEERSKVVEERAKRAQQRGMLKNFIDDYENSSSNDQWQRNNHRNSNPTEYSNDGSNSNSDDDEESSDEENGENQVEESDNDSGKSESSNDEAESESESSSENENSEPKNNVGDKHFIQEKVIHTYDLTKWNSTISSKGQNLHILRTPSTDIVANKRNRIDEAGNYKVSSVNGYHSTSPKGTSNHQYFQVQNCKTYNNDSTQGVRIDYLKSTREISS